MADDKTADKQPLEVLVFRRPDPEVGTALAAAVNRGSEVLALCAIPAGKDSATIRVFWDGQIQARFPQVPLMIAHESESSIGDMLPQFAVEWEGRNPQRALKFTLLSDAAQSWGSVRLPLLVRKLRRHLDVALYR